MVLFFFGKMEFEERLKSSLLRDRSNKGSIDSGVKDLVESINSFQNLFTTSSCSGRVAVVKKVSNKKKDLEFLFCSHEKLVDINPIKNKLMFDDRPGSVWLLFQPTILHVCCKSIEDGEWLFSNARKAGYKRTGIISLKKNVMVEIMGTDFIEHLLYDDEGIYYTDHSLERIVFYVNQKFEENFKKISRFLDILDGGC